MKGKFAVLIMVVVTLLAIWFAFFLLDVYTPDEDENGVSENIPNSIKAWT